MGEVFAVGWFFHWVYCSIQFWTNAYWTTTFQFYVVKRFVFTFWTFTSWDFWEFRVAGVAGVDKMKVGRAVLFFEVPFRGAFLEGLGRWVALEGSFDLFVDLIDLSELGFEHSLIGELEIFEE